MRYHCFLSMDVSRKLLGMYKIANTIRLGPGSFIEVRKILPLLVKADDEHPSFHVVALSLPGYGFSEAPKKPGFELKQFAEVCTDIVLDCRRLMPIIQVGNKLMLALGYNEYGE